MRKLSTPRNSIFVVLETRLFQLFNMRVVFEKASLYASTGVGLFLTGSSQKRSFARSKAMPAAYRTIFPNSEVTPSTCLIRQCFSCVYLLIFESGYGRCREKTVLRQLAQMLAPLARRKNQGFRLTPPYRSPRVMYEAKQDPVNDLDPIIGSSVTCSAENKKPTVRWVLCPVF